MASILSGRNYFNPRSPRRERPFGDISCAFLINFNPRSPRRERRGYQCCSRIAESFQSTLPEKGATIEPAQVSEYHYISIHAPREGSDISPAAGRNLQTYFNPRSPRRERPPKSPETTMEHHFNPRSPRRERRTASTARCTCTTFQSTLPEKGATFFGAMGSGYIYISIHAPREGSNPSMDRITMTKRNFNPRSPRRERRRKRSGLTRRLIFQSTLPEKGATGFASGSRPGRDHFNPRSPRRERQQYPPYYGR